MGRFATAAIIALALAGAAVESHADDLAGPAPAPDAPPAQPGVPPPPPGPGSHAWPGMHPDMRGAMWRMRQMEQTWGLLFNQRDKNLSDSDVQVLAEAILLMHGNHLWKVIDLADAADGQATFAYATADGSVIARFEIDRHSGRITRIG